MVQNSSSQKRHMPKSKTCFLICKVAEGHIRTVPQTKAQQILDSLLSHYNFPAGWWLPPKLSSAYFVAIDKRLNNIL